MDHTLEPQNLAHVWDGGVVFLLKWRMLSELGQDGVAVMSQEQPTKQHSGLGTVNKVDPALSPEACVWWPLT